MSYLAPLPSELRQVEYIKLYYHLQFRVSFDLPQVGLLQLRRELLQTLRTQESLGDSRFSGGLKELFQPPLSSDPMVRRVAQKPSPAFVLQPDTRDSGLKQAGEKIVLPVLFVGQRIQAIVHFGQLLAQLGQQGIYHGQGQFLLEGIETEDASGLRSMLWKRGEKEPSTLPQSDLYWLLERLPRGGELVFEVCSPMRLLHKKKPLFRTDFRTLFPFIMRRVSAMVATHAGVELFSNPQRLMDLAGQVEVLENTLKWQDWRRLSGTGYDQDIGGLLGRMHLSGPALGEISWLLQLGSLLNVGRGAAYGYGQCALRSYR